MVIINLKPVKQMPFFKENQMRYLLFSSIFYILALLVSIGVFYYQPQSDTLKEKMAVNKAGNLINEGKYEKAVDVLEDVTSLRKYASASIVSDAIENPNLHRNLAISYLNSGNLEAAKKEFDLVFQLDPVSSINYYNYGIYLYKLKDYEKAKLNFLKAAEIDPGLWNAYLYAGYMCSLLGNIRQAIYYYELVIQIVPDSYEANYLLAKAYFDIDDRTKAKSLIKSLLASEPPLEQKTELEEMLLQLSKYETR
jgi:tetratricopeptide (TPR) repeat protein